LTQPTKLLAFRRIRERFASLDDNDDVFCLESAKAMLEKV
jgi:hypothetical protein